MNIFVGNISPDVSDQELEDAFAKYGKVRSTKIIRDLFSQQSKGFGFVEMMNNTEAASAMKELNTAELKGKRIIVNEARPPKDKKGRRR
ncbi:MAG: RNA-binding protein [Ignavibacteriae bacterium]|jgi:RNA recognition motif-containing protein|nr:RNA-binding protein [Ignavibacteriota bacterium]NOG98870.1 RNA-binding protein [Ignavibacteriota bacterium]